MITNSQKIPSEVPVGAKPSGESSVFEHPRHFEAQEPQMQVVQPSENGILFLTPGMPIPEGLKLVNPDGTPLKITSPMYVYLNQTTGDPYSQAYDKTSQLSFNDIATILGTANSIAITYTYMCNLIPSEDSFADQSILKKAGNVIILYAQVKYLIIMFSQNKSQLIGQLQQLSSYFYSAEVTELDMINFYGFQTQYFQAKSTYQQLPNVQAKQDMLLTFKKISEVAGMFANSFKNISIAVKQLVTVAQIFDKQIQELSTVNSSDSLIASISKLNDYVMVLAKFVTVKQDVDKAVAGLSSNINNLTAYRANLSILMKMLAQQNAMAAVEVAKLKMLTMSSLANSALCLLLGTVALVNL